MAASSGVNKSVSVDYNKMPLLESNRIKNNKNTIGFGFFEKNAFKTKIDKYSAIAREVNVGQLLRRGVNKLNRSVFITPQNSIFILFNTHEDRVIGSGGQKKVKLALNVVTGEIFAYKVVRNLYSQEERDAIVAEYELGLSLRGDSLCKPIIGTLRVEEDRVVYLEEYMPLRDLTRFLAEPVIEKAVLPLAAQMASALADLHDQGYLSRDIKPANYFIERIDQGIPVVRLGDFGEAVPIGSPSPKKREPVWTYGFVSPEYKRAADIDQKNDRAQAVAVATTQKNDSWALGVSLLALFQRNLSAFVDSNPNLKEFLNSKDSDLFVQGLFNDSEWIKKPEDKNTLEYVIYKLLIVDPERRWTPRQAADRLQSIKLEFVGQDSSVFRVDSPMSQGEQSLIDPMSTERQDSDLIDIQFGLDELALALESLD